MSRAPKHPIRDPDERSSANLWAPLLIVAFTLACVFGIPVLLAWIT